MWNMGFYYDKDFVETDRTELERCRVAAQYYSAVARHTESDIAGWNGDFKELRIRSSRDLIKMVAGLSPRERISFQKVVEEIRALGLISAEEVDELFTQGKSRSASLHRRLEDLLTSAVSKKRAPTFGVLFASVEELRQSIDILLKADVVVKTKKLEFSFAPLDDNFRYIAYQPDRDFRPVITEDSIRAKVESEDLGESNVAIYFFNNAGKHGIYNGSGERAKIRKWIEDKQYQAIMDLIESAKGHPCIFFDDDIFYYQKQKRFAADVVELIREDI